MKLLTCTRCSTEQSEDNFYKASGSQYKSHWNVRDSMCKPCRMAYGTERRHKIKQMAVEYLGGCCLKCGIRSSQYCIYDFHHRDPSQKDFSFGKVNKGFEQIKPELDKCDLLCANCHRIIHDELLKLIR